MTQDETHTTPQKLNAIPCRQCRSVGLELEPDGHARCKSCGAVNELAGPACPRCEYVSGAGACYCEACGALLTFTCPRCQTGNWSGAEKCANCGQYLDTLGVLMERSGDTGLRFHARQRDLASLAAQEDESARQRRAYLEEIDRRRQQAIAEAAARKAREERLFITATLIFAALALLTILAFTVFALLNR
ncbi:MAG: zinc ribbon domain-containing protein [Anaerolineales bacterium]|nr:zinc ribbon domain-containing protein [Anaerolineales bacterium]